MSEMLEMKNPPHIHSFSQFGHYVNNLYTRVALLHVSIQHWMFCIRDCVKIPIRFQNKQILFFWDLFYLQTAVIQTIVCQVFRSRLRCVPHPNGQYTILTFLKYPR